MSKFQDIINGTKPVLVDFHATWCGPCKTMAPILKELKNKMGQDITILKIDVDTNQRIASDLKISGVPTLILFKKGKLLWRQSGVIPVHKLQEIIKQHI